MPMSLFVVLVILSVVCHSDLIGKLKICNPSNYCYFALGSAFIMARSSYRTLIFLTVMNFLINFCNITVK